MVKAWKVLGVIFFVAVFSSGCASITSQKQKIKFASFPENAKVYFNNKEIGQTPGFYEIPRKSEGKLTYKLGSGASKTVELQTHYRWGDSFFANFVWFIWGAPIGWGIDLVTGAAWDYDSPAQVALVTPPFKDPPSVYAGKKKIAIAPPQTNYILLSDEVAQLVEKRLKELFPQDIIVPFKNTEGIFHTFNYDFESEVSPSSRDDLYSELETTHIAETIVIREENQIIVKTKITDEFSDNITDGFSMTVSKDKLSTFTKRSSMAEIFSQVLDIVPNNISYGLKTPVNLVEIEPTFANPYVAYLDSSGSVFNYLAGLGFKNVRNPKLFRGLRPIFRFVPSITIDYTRTKFLRPDANNDLNGMSFDWYLLSTCIGPEIGLESSIGYFYFQLMPGIGVSHIQAHGQQGNFGIWDSSFVIEAEIGYLVFLSNHINIRFYSNAATGFGSAWQQAMSFMAGYNIPVKSASDAVAGIAIGYYFPESQSTVQGWLF